MMTQPATLVVPSRAEAAVSGALLASFASSILGGLNVLMSCGRVGQAPFEPPKGLSYPMSARAKRLMRNPD